MQGAIARAALCPNARRVTFGCPAARVRHVPRGLSGGGGKWCVAAAAGERGRDVPGVADARPVAEGRHAAGAGPGAVAPPRGARRGSVAGAVALIVGTSIGSGILAVPQRTAPAVSFSCFATPQRDITGHPDPFTIYHGRARHAVNAEARRNSFPRSAPASCGQVQGRTRRGKMLLPGQ